MLRGLEELAQRLAEIGIPFHLLAGDPAEKIPEFICACRAGLLVADFDPLRIKRQWKQAVSQRIEIFFYEVDAHNIVPCWLASPKQEFFARTLKIKYGRILDDFLDEFPKQERSSTHDDAAAATDWKGLRHFIQAAHDIPEIQGVKAGESILP